MTAGNVGLTTRRAEEMLGQLARRRSCWPVSRKGAEKPGYDHRVKNATVCSSTKSTLGALLDRVRRGETVVITDHDKPIARLVPVENVDADEDRLARLESSGLIRRVRRTRLEEIARTLPPEPEPGADAVAALVEERRTGR